MRQVAHADRRRTRWPALIEPLTDLVIRAGAAILAVNRSAMKVDGKTGRIAGDGSRSRRRPHHRRRPGAAGAADIRHCPRSASHLAKPPYKDSFFLIDPLDGTKEFVAGRNEFTVNLALVTDGMPLLGIVGAPALGLIWRGIVGRGAERLTLLRRRAVKAIEPIRTRPCPTPENPGPWRSAARMAMPGPKPLSPPARRRARRTRLGGQIRPGGGRRGRHLSPPVADLANGMSRRATRWSRPPAARSRIQPAPRCISARPREIHRAGIHRLGRSGRPRPDYCASSCSSPASGRRRLSGNREDRP